MLVASQVLLSIILPTVIFPLVLICSKEDVMTVEGIEEVSTGTSNNVQSPPTASEEITPVSVDTSSGPAPAILNKKTKSYKSPLWITVIGYFLFAIVIIANTYVIVELILGNA